jgi:hypothetical protein
MERPHRSIKRNITKQNSIKRDRWHNRWKLIVDGRTSSRPSVIRPKKCYKQTRTETQKTLEVIHLEELKFPSDLLRNVTDGTI